MVISDTNEILRCDNNGNSLSSFKTGGPALSEPAALAFGPDGNLYVPSGGNSILRYNRNTGAFIDTFASGSGLGDFWATALRHVKF